VNIKIFVASFALVFLAELGDKTQLAALGFAASSRSPVAVFLGTSLALVCSTALAVVLGTVIGAHLPEKIVQIGAGVLFVLVGVFLLVNVARRAPEAGAEAAEAPGDQFSGTAPTFRTILSHALAFEEEAAERIREVAACMERPLIREMLERIADEEEQHRARISSVLAHPESDQSDAECRAFQPPSPPEEFRLTGTGISVESGQTGEVCRKAIENLIRAEEAAAAFYLALARTSHISHIRRSFRWLAAQELDHVSRLSEAYEQIQTSSPAPANGEQNLA